MNNARFFSIFLSFFILLDPVFLQNLIPENVSKSDSKKTTTFKSINFTLFQSSPHPQLLNRTENSNSSYDQWDAFGSKTGRLPKILSGGTIAFISLPHLPQEARQNLKRGPPTFSFV